MFWDVGGIRGCRGCQGCIVGLAGTLGTQGPQEVYGALGAPRGFRGVKGPFWGCQGHQGVSGVYWGESGLGAQPHWAPVQCPSTPTSSPGGVTYWANAKKVTEMSSAGYYIHFELYFITVFIFVYIPPHHIFLHTILGNVLWTIFSADQFMHILT